jgi:hypothetical protein
MGKQSRHHTLDFGLGSICGLGCQQPALDFHCLDLVQLHSPAKQFIAVLVELQHPRIPVAIRDVDVAISVPGNVGWLIEVPHVISGNTHPPQCNQHPPFRAQLQNHMRADVGGPNVVFGVDAHHVRRHEQVVSNAAEEFL